MKDIIIKQSKLHGRGVFATKDFKKGEEITADYTNEGIPFEFRCECGSKNCKGTIGSELRSR